VTERPVGDAAPRHQPSEPRPRLRGCRSAPLTPMGVLLGVVLLVAGVVVAVSGETEEVPVPSPQLPPGAEEVP